MLIAFVSPVDLASSARPSAKWVALAQCFSNPTRSLAIPSALPTAEEILSSRDRLQLLPLVAAT